jgi:hypothetical protein
MTKGPIRPDQIDEMKRDALPQLVFDVFNELIAANWNGGRAVVLQKKAAKLIAERAKTATEEVYRRHWLDVEDAYREAGWDVDYDKPGYCEDYEATFTFRKK